MLSKFSVKKPLTIVVSMILIIILGVISFTKMTTDLLPSVDLPYVIVMTTYPGASPEKIENEITKPLEKALSVTSGLKNVMSVSSENSSMVMLEFEESINMDSAMIEMDGYIDLVKGSFDDLVGAPMLMKMNPNMLPIMTTSIDVEGMDIKEISKYVEEEIVPEFERIEGVASVDITGAVKEEVRITLNNEKIEELNNKVLASIDDKLAKTESELKSGLAEIEEGKKQLSEEVIKQNTVLIEGSLELQAGKDQLENALNSLPETRAQLVTKREELAKQKKLLEELIKVQESTDIPIIEAQKKLLKQLTDGIAQIDISIKQIDEKQPGLEDSLITIINSEKDLEIGRVTLNQELTKAQLELASAEVELKSGLAEFNKAKEEAYKNAGLENVLSQEMIGQILMAENFSMPAGYISEDGQRYLVKVGENFKTIEEVKDLVLFNMDIEGIGEITLDSIAKVEQVDNSEEIYAKVNGNDAVFLAFQKQSTSPTAEVSSDINKKLEELMEKDQKLNFEVLLDQGIYIDIVVNTVLDNLIMGGVLAIIILLIFLRNIKTTVIIAFSIPISLMFAMVLMYFSGVTMNIISLSGLALGVGMLVDNSIVVIENIYRLRNEGMSKATAAVKGAAQVSGAIFASTLTTICVFLPIVFTEGLSRQLFTDMGLTIAYSLLASLIIALTLVPTMASTMLNDTSEKEHKFFDKIVNKYEKLLSRALKHRAIILVSVTILLVVSIFLAMSNGTILIPTMDSTQLSLTLEMDKESNIDDLRAMSNSIIDKISEIDDVKTIGAMENSQGNMMGGGGNPTMSMYVILKDDKELSSIEVGDIIEEKTKDLNCELKISTSNMDMSAMTGSGVEVIIHGTDLDVIRNIAKDIGVIIDEVEGTVDVENGLTESTMETRVIVDKNKAMKYGLTVAQVYQEITDAISTESTATELNFTSNSYPVILVKNTEITRSNLGDYIIEADMNGEVKKIKVSEIATITEAESLQSITHDNQVRTLSIKAGIDSNHNVGLVNDNIEKKIEGYELPDGYTITMGGEMEAIATSFKDLFMMIALAVVFIYLIMVAQFQSFLSPGIVMFTIPLAFTGGFFGLFISNTEVSMLALLGFLVLSGIIVNNGIVFVDYVNQLRLEGMEKHEALILAGKTRLRPILMTALTTILGLSTLALGVGVGTEMMQPMAIVTIGGLIYATILTLFVVPIMYDILHRKEMKKIEIEV